MDVSAQKYWDASRPDHRFTFGVRAGGSFSKYYTEDHADTQFAPGLLLGLAADVNIIRSLSVTSGIYYVQKRTKFEVKVQNKSIKRTLHPAYLEIPLLLSYRIPLSDDSQFQFNVGPYYAFGLTNSARETFETLYKKDDLGLSLGVAVTYSHYYFGANYERSIRNISRDVYTADQSASRMYNGSIIVSAGYNF